MIHHKAPASAWEDHMCYAALFRPWLRGEVPAPSPRLSKADIAPLIALTETIGTKTSLAWALKNRDLTPDLRAYVELALLYGRGRAERRRQGIEILASAFNAIGVMPLLLKGSAAQIGGVYPDAGFRLMADIDLLVPLDQFAACVAAAEEAGFHATDTQDYGHTHAPQAHKALGVKLEIHRQITRVYERDNFPAKAMLDKGSPEQLGSATVLMPDWSSQAVLVILHSLAWDRTRFTAKVPWKALLDLAALKASPHPISWHMVSQELEAIGERACLWHIEVLFGELFGLPLTGVGIPESSRRRILRYYKVGARYPFLSRAGSLANSLRNRWKNLLYQPRRILKLGQSEFYRGILSNFRKLAP